MNNSTERISIFLMFECKIVARFVISMFRVRHNAFCHTITGARIPERREQPMKELVQRRPSCAALLSSSESRGGDVRLAVYADCRAVTDSVPRGPRDFPLWPQVRVFSLIAEKLTRPFHGDQPVDRFLCDSTFRLSTVDRQFRNNACVYLLLLFVPFFSRTDRVTVIRCRMTRRTCFFYIHTTSLLEEFSWTVFFKAEFTKLWIIVVCRVLISNSRCDCIQTTFDVNKHWGVCWKRRFERILLDSSCIVCKGILYCLIWFILDNWYR